VPAPENPGYHFGFHRGKPRVRGIAAFGDNHPGYDRFIVTRRFSLELEIQVSHRVQCKGLDDIWEQTTHSEPAKSQPVATGSIKLNRGALSASEFGPDDRKPKFVCFVIFTLASARAQQAFWSFFLHLTLT